MPNDRNIVFVSNYGVKIILNSTDAVVKCLRSFFQVLSQNSL